MGPFEICKIVRNILSEQSTTENIICFNTFTGVLNNVTPVYSKTYGYLRLCLYKHFIKIQRFRDTKSGKLLTSQLDIGDRAILLPFRSYKNTTYATCKILCMYSLFRVLFIFSFQCNVNFQSQTLGFPLKIREKFGCDLY